MRPNNKAMIRLFTVSMAFLLGTYVVASAQTTQTQNATEPVQAPTQNQPANPFAGLDLKPDQIQKIRMINAELKDERQAAALRLRQTQRALNDAIESPTPNESLIEQRSREVAAAQAQTIRLRSLTEARVLQVLTPEQRVRLREMQRRSLAARSGRQQQTPNGLDRRQGLRGNANNPVLTPAQRRALRRQQKP
ncbi:MAG: Spy/CpxP family protein refolding chaperone [Pyrinomonadaceae bacterium]